jgi:putative ABC transport system permease protein
MSEVFAATAGVLGALCLLVACVGIYGVAAYNAEQRTRKLGVRMALGAKPRDILAMVLRQNLRAVMSGVALGIAGAAAFARLLTSMLYGVEPTDPPAFPVTLSILIGTSILAIWDPTRRCSRVDPAVTLRHE